MVTKMSLPKPLSYCIFLLLLLTGDCISQGIGPGGERISSAVFDEYRAGKIGNEEFSRRVNREVEQAPNSKAKAEMLSGVLAYLSGGVDGKHDVDDLVIHYSTELVALSDRPDRVAEALVRIASSMGNQAKRVNGEEKRIKLLSALVPMIEASKIISENLRQSKVIPPPSGNGYVFIGDLTSPQYIALEAKHKAQLAARVMADEQNNMVWLWKRLGPALRNL